MTTQYTPEPWSLDVYGPRGKEEAEADIFGGDDVSIIDGSSGLVSPANARRIVACVNACAGIPDNKLSDGCILELAVEQEIAIMKLEKQRDELLAALEGLTGWFNSETKDSAYKYLDKAEQAIAKAKGGAA